MTASDCLEKPERAAIPAYEKVLSVVNILTRDGFLQRKCSPAEYALPLEQENREVSRADSYGSGKPAKATADDNVRLHRGVLRAASADHGFATQTYFRRWLSQ